MKKGTQTEQEKIQIQKEQSEILKIISSLKEAPEKAMTDLQTKMQQSNKEALRSKTSDGKVILYELIKSLGNDADKYLVNNSEWTELAKLCGCEYKITPKIYNDTKNIYGENIYGFTAKFAYKTCGMLLDQQMAHPMTYGHKRGRIRD